jgi:hypothetical protein
MPGFGRFSRGKPQPSNMGQDTASPTADDMAAVAPPNNTTWMQFDQPLDFGHDIGFDGGDFDSSAFDFPSTNETPEEMLPHTAEAAGNSSLGLSKFKTKVAAAMVTNVPQDAATVSVHHDPSSNPAPPLTNLPPAQPTASGLSSFVQGGPPAPSPRPSIGTTADPITVNQSGLSLFASGFDSVPARNQYQSTTPMATERTGTENTIPSTTIPPRSTNINDTPSFQDNRPPSPRPSTGTNSNPTTVNHSGLSLFATGCDSVPARNQYQSTTHMATERTGTENTIPSTMIPPRSTNINDTPSFQDIRPPSPRPLTGTNANPTTVNHSGLSLFATGCDSVPARNQYQSTTRMATERTGTENTLPSTTIPLRSTNINDAPSFQDNRPPHGSYHEHTRILESTMDSSTRVLPLPTTARAPGARQQQANGGLLQTPNQDKRTQGNTPGSILPYGSGLRSPNTHKDSFAVKDKAVFETPRPMITQGRPRTTMPSITPSPVMANPRTCVQNHPQDPLSIAPSANSRNTTHSTSTADRTTMDFADSTSTADSTTMDFGNSTSTADSTTMDFGDLHAKFLSDIRDLQDLQDGNGTRLLTMDSVFATAYSVTLYDQAQFLSLIDQLEDLTNESDKTISKFQDF